MQKILFDAELSVHKFGSYLLHVPSLRNWADSKGLYLPKTNPPIEDYEFVQVESLLVAIMRVVHSSMTPEEGFRTVQNNPKLNGNQLAQHPITAKWLIGADVHSQWRKQITSSIKKGELKLLEFGSLLPVTSEDLEVLLSSMPHTQTGAIETLQKESKVDEETNGRDAGQAGNAQTGARESNQNGASNSNTTFGTTKRWTPEVVEELVTYHVIHGTKKAAEKYGVTPARIREVLRIRKPQPSANNTFPSPMLKGKTTKVKR